MTTPPAGTPSTGVTKIVATIGPASASPDVIRRLIHAGMNVARLNFSHGAHEQHARTVENIRGIAQDLGKPIAILGDLQGPRIRIGALAEAITIEEGQTLVLAPEDACGAGEIPITYDALAADVMVGGTILVDDGLLALEVTKVDAPRVHAKVRYGGLLKSNKGMNLPGIDVSAPSITDKDREDIQFAIEQDLDYLALSFVRRAEDIAELKAMLPKGMLVVAKIEKDSALERIEAILKATDAVMVARGDLGVELPFEQVPLQQKRIIGLANRYGRPVITATQMLESMIQNPRPTRAEASDVANAILDGTDAVMLSAETAAGLHPVLAVQAMRRIATAAEQAPVERGQGIDRLKPGTATVEETIASASVTAVRLLGAQTIVVFTKSGFSARIVAARRPNVRIVVLTDNIRTYNQLAMTWGVTPFLVPHCDTYTQMTALARELLVKHGIAVPGERVVITAGVPFDVPGTTNQLKVETV
ncbi:MAG: pyruvate kinase [Gemmatimonadaceae bacterium]|nr:pyruvate kinase [Gemmatimonadaceae bacterium]MCW5826231.1 pyruvate kinase [Gemmatimonadaceae bacterium]